MRVNNVLLNNAKRSGFLTKTEVVSRQSVEQLDYQVEAQNIVSHRGNGEDIRFCQKGQLLQHWKESYASWLSAAWTKLPRLPATKSQILFALSGSPSASSASTGDCFEFFDDFLGSAYDADKWQEIGTPTVTVANSLCKVTSDSGYEHLQAKTLILDNWAMRTKVATIASQEAQIYMIYPNINGAGRYALGWRMETNSRFHRFENNVGTYDWTGSGDEFTGNILEIQRDGNYWSLINGVEKVSNHAYTDGGNALAPSFGGYTPGWTQLDWLLIRKYASPEPLIVKRMILSKAGMMKAICGGIAA